MSLTNLHKSLILLEWRRGRDSNPRYGCPYAAFRVRCIQPLCHLSGAENSLKRPHADGRYLTKRAQRDKRQVRVARRILSDLEREPAADRQNDAPRPEIRVHPQGIARGLRDARSGRRPDYRAFLDGLGIRARTRLCRLTDRYS